MSNADVPLTALSEGTREQEEQRMPPPEEDPIVAEFIIEAREHLSDVENQLLAIEASGADIDVELVNTVFRAVHSIKGAAGFLGFTGVCRLAHTLENVLNLIRNQELVPASTNTDVMLRAADTLRAMVNDIHQSSYVDISNHVAELQQIADDVPGENETASTASAEREPTVLGSTDPTEPQELTHGAQDSSEDSSGTAPTAAEAHRPDASLVQADEPSVPPRLSSKTRSPHVVPKVQSSVTPPARSLAIRQNPNCGHVLVPPRQQTLAFAYRFIYWIA